MTSKPLKLDVILDALGHQTRRKILAILKNEPASVISIADRLPISRPAVSKHLRLLERANLVKFETQGARHIFRIDSSGFQAARQYLDQFEA